ncbi:MAG: hypothetical protein OXN83_04285 [Oligoflexia bacterium]|nr:hypothetical protein [Oligoflexia bacterium]
MSEKKGKVRIKKTTKRRAREKKVKGEDYKLAIELELHLKSKKRYSLSSKHN